MSIEIRRSSIEGKGIFATTNIAKYMPVYEVKIIREITEDKPLTEGERYDHCLWYPDGRMNLVGEPDCYHNHYCGAANTYLYSINKKYFIYAKQDIFAGEELTLDYILYGHDGDSWECKCGSPVCRRYHKFDLFEQSDQFIIENLPYIDPWFFQVHEDKFEEIVKRNVLFNCSL